MSKLSKLRLLQWIIAGGLALSCAYHYWNSAVRGLGFPWDSFLFDPRARFKDFFDILAAAASRAPYQGFPSVYFPFGFFSILPFTWLPQNTALGILFALFLGFLTAFHWYWLRVPGRRWGSHLLTVAVFTWMPFPVLFALDRANSELLVFVTIGVWLMAEHWRDRHPAAEPIALIALGAAVAMKAYPALYLWVYLTERRYRAIAAVLTIAGGLTAVSLLSFHGPWGAHLAGWRTNLASYRLGYAIDQAGLAYNVSFWGFEKLFFGNLLGFAKDPSGDPARALIAFSERFAPVNSLFTLACLLFLTWTAWKRASAFEYWKRIALPTLALITLSEVSGAYKLLHLFFPIALFVNEGKKSRLDGWYATALGLAMIPKDYGYVLLHHMYPASIATVIDPLLLAAIAVMILWKPNREPATS